ncbi:selenoprotein H-like [Scleropages formosus]|uniref:Selenoprotein H-like n=1 Tax=Scleropages formosus TaxID=113540 RepID=A0A0P7XE35_SCLFO|nr:selenoprotein H-like [Scleropages formosus]
MASRGKAAGGRKRKAPLGQVGEEAPDVKSKKKEEDELEKEQGQRIVIEHCRHAEGLREALEASNPELKVQINPEKPRRNSFEVTLFGEGKGIKKGPPRKLKFPDPAVVVSSLQEVLKTH